MNSVALQTLEVARVEKMRQRWGRRFTERFFTEGERRFCEPRRQADQHFAARLAAKLAVWRLLGPMRLRDAEVVRDAAGAPSLVLGGTAAQRVIGRRLHLSLSHDGGVAVALLVGEQA